MQLILQEIIRGFAFLVILADLWADNPGLIKRIIPLKGLFNGMITSGRMVYGFLKRETKNFCVLSLE